MHYFLYMFDHFCVSSSQDAATFFRDRCLIWHSQCRRRAVIWRRCVMAESMERMVIEGKSTCQRPKPQRSQGHGYSNLCWFVDILRFHCIFSMIPKSFGLCGCRSGTCLTQKIYSLEMLHQLRATQITSNVCRYRGYVLDAGNECPPSAALSVSQCWNCKQNLSGSYSNSQPHCTSMEGSKSQRSWIHMLCLHQPTSPVDPED